MPHPSHEAQRHRLRIGIVGAGLITARSHLPAVAACADVELAALVDTSAERARDLADRFGQTPRIATDVGDVLAGLDAAIIATPNASHCELAVHCLEAGVHVLIEKPLATSVMEGKAIAAAAHKAGKVAAVGYDRRFLSTVPLMKELIEDGYFGELRRFVYQFGSIGGWAPLSGYNLQRTSAGGGVLAVVGSHFLDRLVYWFGLPDACACLDDSRGGPEATAVSWFRYSDGLKGEARLSKTIALPEGFALETAKGLVTFREEDDELVLHPHDRSSLELRLRARAGEKRRQRSTHARQLENFVAACRGQAPPMVPVEQGLVTQQLIDTLYTDRQPLMSGATARPATADRHRVPA